MRKAGIKLGGPARGNDLASPNIGPHYVCRRVAGIDVWYVAAGVGIHTDLFARLREKSSCALQKYFSGKGAKTQRKAAQESRKKTVANSSARG
jgi:hypothetical protein